MSLKKAHDQLRRLDRLCAVKADHARFEALSAAKAEADQAQKLNAAERRIEDALQDWRDLSARGRIDPRFLQAYAQLADEAASQAQREKLEFERLQLQGEARRREQAGAEAQAEAIAKRAAKAAEALARRRDDEKLDGLQILRAAGRIAP